MGCEIDWDLRQGRRQFVWPVTTRHHIPIERVVALITDTSDVCYSQIARVDSISEGIRIHKRDKTEEPCWLLELTTSRGARGWWYQLFPGEIYIHGAHPAPKVFHMRAIADCYGATLMHSRHQGPKDFWREATHLRCNGHTSDEERAAIRARLQEEYDTLFRKR